MVIGVGVRILHAVARGLLTYGARSPAAVAADGRVVDACRLARYAGATAGTPLQEALRRCPDLTLLPFDPTVAQAWYRTALPWAEAVEPGPTPVALTLALAPGARPREAARAIAQSARADAVDVGGGPNRLVARLAARARRGLVTAEEAPHFLEPLSVGWLLDPLTPAEVAALCRLGCGRLGQVAALPEPLLRDAVGGRAGLVRALAAGIDPRPVERAFPPPEVRVRHAFGRPTDPRPALGLMGARLAAGLAARGMACRRLALALDGRESERRLPRPARAAEALARGLARLGAGRPEAAVVEAVARDLTPLEGS